MVLGDQHQLLRCLALEYDVGKTTATSPWPVPGHKEVSVMDKKGRRILGATVGGAVGGFLGAVFGGPNGAVVGAAAASWVGHQIDDWK